MRRRPCRPPGPSWTWADGAVASPGPVSLCKPDPHPHCTGQRVQNPSPLKGSPKLRKCAPGAAGALIPVRWASGTRVTQGRGTGRTGRKGLQGHSSPLSQQGHARHAATATRPATRARPLTLAWRLRPHQLGPETAAAHAWSSAWSARQRVQMSPHDSLSSFRWIGVTANHRR